MSVPEDPEQSRAMGSTRGLVLEVEPRRKSTCSADQSFKWTTLEEAVAGSWLREPALDIQHWPGLDLSERLELAEQALRELYAEGLICFVHSRTGEYVEREDMDRMFASRTGTGASITTSSETSSSVRLSADKTGTVSSSSSS